VCEEIARGGLGVILRGQDVDLGRDVALKVLHERHADDADMIRRLIEEAQIGGQLQHPGIVPVYEVGIRNERQPFFAMKLVSGETLASQLARRGTLESDRHRFLTIFEHVCQTVAYAHARGVIHRDLKPSNVMVGSFGEVQVVDWGLAKVLGSPSERPRMPTDQDASDHGPGAAVLSGSQAGTVLGTWAYMPPEQARGEIDRLDARTDVFALGSILCEILTGRPAYVASNRDELRELARAGALDDAHRRLAQCAADPELIALAATCLTSERDARPADAAALANAMRAHLAAVEERIRKAEIAAIGARAQAAEDRARTAEAEAAAEAARAARQRTIGGFTAATILLIAVFGSYTWLSNQRRARIERGTRAVTDALERAMVLSSEARAAAARNLAKWKEAESAIAAAKALAAMGEIEPTATERLERLDREVSEDAERARLEAAQAESDARMAQRLEEIRGINDCEDMSPERSRQFYGAFREYGIDVFKLDVQDAGRRIRESAISRALIDALDVWTYEAPVENRPINVAFQEHGSRLLAVARHADADPFRSEIRDVMSARIREGIRALLADPRVETASPESLMLLATGSTAIGDLDTAERLMKTASLKDAGSFWIHHAYANFLGNHPRSVERKLREYQAALAIRPKSSHVWRHLALTLLDVKDPDAALEAAEQAVRCAPESNAAYLVKGQVLSGLGRAEEAKAAFNEALARGPERGGSWHYHGITLRETKDLEGSRVALEHALEMTPDSEVVEFALAKTLRELGELDHAAATLHQTLERGTRTSRIRNELAEVLSLKQDWKNAATEFQRVIDMGERFPRVYNNLAASLAHLGDHAGALAAAREAVRLEPDNELYLLNEVLFTSQAGQHEQALVKLNVLDVELRENPKLKAVRGQVLRHLDRPREAVEALRDAAAALPEDVNVRCELGLALSESGDPESALEEFRTALAIRPGAAHVHALIAVVLRNNGDIDGALSEIAERLRLDPGSGHDWAEMGSWLTRTPDFAAADEALRKAIEFGDKGLGELALGFVLMLQGRPEESLQHLRTGSSPRVSAQDLRAWTSECERMIELAPHVDDPVSPPGCSPEDLILIARMQAAHGRNADVVRTYGDAFRAKPELEDKYVGLPRFRAAEAAAQSREFDLCLEWLEAELDRLRTDPQDRAGALCTILRFWKTDPALTRVRDPAQLEKLPPDLRSSFEQLWSDVDEFLERETAAQEASPLRAALKPREAGGK
jgi:serine/threonine-protein kinase